VGHSAVLERPVGINGVPIIIPLIFPNKRAHGEAFPMGSNSLRHLDLRCRGCRLWLRDALDRSCLFPLMIGVQLMGSRLGIATGRGLAPLIRLNYPRWVLWGTCLLLVTANVINIAADLGGMGDAIADVSKTLLSQVEEFFVSYNKQRCKKFSITDTSRPEKAIHFLKNDIQAHKNAAKK
jgi:Natural resistance-associated macrophage protein